VVEELFDCIFINDGDGVSSDFLLLRAGYTKHAQECFFGLRNYHCFRRSNVKSPYG
jgi:hypothetical protein